MPELPILAFRITAINEFIELSVDEVWGFPNETNYSGGYGAKGTLIINARTYSVSDIHYFTTGELYRFYIELKKCYKTLSGTAILENTENELELKCEFNKFGHVVVLGKFQANPSVGNILIFQIKTDQTQIKETLSYLKTVYEFFGDDKGKPTNLIN